MSQKIELVKKCGLIGGGAGLAAFAVFGLMQGALIGGTAGLGIVNYIFGSGTIAIMGNELLPRILIAASMLTGVLVSLIAFAVAGGVAGAVGGYLLALTVGAGEAVESNYAVQAAAAKKED